MGRLRTFVRNNSLTLVVLSAFLIFVVLQALTGWQVRNEALSQAGEATDSFWAYLGTGHFGEALFENWESEFLQMGAYILLTAYLVQRGSPESKPSTEEERSGDRPEDATANSPALARKRGVLWFLYSNSLSLTLLGFFALSFLAHLISGTAAYNEEQALQNSAPPISVLEFFRSPDFWFQSMQNWQSEFLSVGALVLLSIWLRQRGSPQSKPVTAPHFQTGE